MTGSRSVHLVVVTGLGMGLAVLGMVGCGGDASGPETGTSASDEVMQSSLTPADQRFLRDASAGLLVQLRSEGLVTSEAIAASPNEDWGPLFPPVPEEGLDYWEVAEASEPLTSDELNRLKVALREAAFVPPDETLPTVFATGPTGFVLVAADGKRQYWLIDLPGYRIVVTDNEGPSRYAQLDPADPNGHVAAAASLIRGIASAR